MVEIVPLHLRTRKLPFWDQKPKGYEHLSAEQAKTTGMFLLPCHLLTGTGSINPTPMLIEPIREKVGRNTKRLYVGGLPDGCTEEMIVEFINEQYELKNLDKTPGNPCLGATMNPEKKSCFVEFRNKDEATQALTLEGAELKGHVLKVRRPKDYIAGEDDPHYVPGFVI